MVPSYSHSTSARQYSAAAGSGGPATSARSASAGERISWPTLPGRMVSLRPVVPVGADCGSCHSGCSSRGNSTNMATAHGRPSSAMRPSIGQIASRLRASGWCSSSQLRNTQAPIARLYSASQKGWSDRYSVSSR
ncbi:hypothetical protein D9M72_323410 [compost metagenome]